MITEVDGEDIIRARLGGESERAIARRLRITIQDVRDALDRFSATVLNHHTRLHMLALDLERLDEMITAFRPIAKGGDVQAGALLADREPSHHAWPVAAGARRSGDPRQPGAAGEELDRTDRRSDQPPVPGGAGEAARGRLMDEDDLEAAIAAAVDVRGCARVDRRAARHVCHAPTRDRDAAGVAGGDRRA
jgi:hypothetical protein